MVSLIFEVGNRIRVVNYSPFRGLVGTVQKVDRGSTMDEPVYFYLVALDTPNVQGPLWFHWEEVESVSSREVEAGKQYNE